MSKTISEVNQLRLRFKYGIRCYSGKLKDTVFSGFHSYRLCHRRSFKYPQLSSHHIRMGEIDQHLNALYLQASNECREDLRVYAVRNAMENQSRVQYLRKVMPNAKAIFVHCMWDWAKANPGVVDLGKVSLVEMRAMSAPVRRVSTCVEAGYLKKVSNWEVLSQLV